MLAERDMSQNERFLHNAQMLAIYKAKEDYRQHSNPYILKPRVNSVIDRAQMMYSVVVGPQFTLAQSSDEAQSIFVSEFRKTYYEEIERLSVQDGAESEQLKELLIAARTDKKNDSGGLNEDAGNRAAIRAYISLLPDVPTRQEAVETVLPTLRARVELYQKFYDEFQPKEED